MRHDPAQRLCILVLALALGVIALPVRPAGAQPLFSDQTAAQEVGFTHSYDSDDHLAPSSVSPSGSVMLAS